MRALGWAWIVVGALLPVTGFLAYGWVLVKGTPSQNDAGLLVLGGLGLLGLPLGVLFGGLSVAVGVGLRRSRTWARVGAAVLSLGALGVAAAAAALAPRDVLAALAFFFPGPFLLAALGVATLPALLLARGGSPRPGNDPGASPGP